MDPTTDRLTEIRERAEKALRTPDLEWARDLVYGLANDVLALHSELQALLAKCPEGFSSKYVLGVEHHHRTALAVVSQLQDALQAVTEERDELYETVVALQRFDDRWYPRLAGTAIGEKKLGHHQSAEAWNELCRDFRAALAGVSPGSEDDRDPDCVARWPGCESGMYDPRCCRFPKSCSCSISPGSEEEI